MARARLIKPGFFTNDVLAEVDVFGRLLFIGLWTVADREGRLEDRPKRIKAEVMPFDNVDVDDLLEQLASRGFITRYTVGSLRLIQVEAFTKHQSPHFREAESLLPARGSTPSYETEALGQPEALGPSIDPEPETSPGLGRVKAVPSPAVAVAVAVTSSGRAASAQPKPGLDDDYLEALQVEEPSLDIKAFAADYLNWKGSRNHKDKRQGFRNQLRIEWKREQFRKVPASMNGTSPKPEGPKVLPLLNPMADGWPDARPEPDGTLPPKHRAEAKS